VFGSYKPSVGKREVVPKKPESFSSYNPPFGDSKKDTGLDFSKKRERTISTPPKDKDLVFGSYQPTFGESLIKTSSSSGKDGNVLDGSTRRAGRRGHDDLGQKSNPMFGDDIFNKDTKQNKATSLFNEDSFSRPNDKSHPWERKVNVSKQSVDESLLPRRQKIHSNLNKGHEQNVPAIGNVLHDTIDDDIEEVTL
jgi:hypothetical protein